MNDNTGEYETDIYFDINGVREDTGGPNCIYDRNTCTNPDRFKIMITAAGEVIAADPVGEFYLKTRKSWLKKDMEIDDNSVVMASLDNSKKNFAMTLCNGDEIEPDVVEDAGGNSSGDAEIDVEVSECANDKVMIHGVCQDIPQLVCGGQFEGYHIICYSNSGSMDYILTNQHQFISLIEEPAWDKFLASPTHYSCMITVGKISFSEVLEAPPQIKGNSLKTKLATTGPDGVAHYIDEDVNCSSNYVLSYPKYVISHHNGEPIYNYKCSPGYSGAISYGGPACDAKNLYISARSAGAYLEEWSIDKQTIKPAIQGCQALQAPLP